MKIQQVVVMYLHDHQISRPPAPPVVSPCKGIMSCFSFMFLGVPRHYPRRSFNCWFKVTRVCVAEDTVTASSGIRNCDVRVAEIVVRELEKAKPDKWA